MIIPGPSHYYSFHLDLSSLSFLFDFQRLCSFACLFVAACSSLSLSSAPWIECFLIERDEGMIIFHDVSNRMQQVSPCGDCL
jgi:hypothetical protein